MPSPPQLNSLPVYGGRGIRMSALNRFHERASDALEKISASLPAGAKLCLSIYTPEKPELDIVLQDKGLDLNEVVSTLRRRGLSIDGDNAY